LHDANRSVIIDKQEIGFPPLDLPPISNHGVNLATE
jgi:hypothetical protein